MSRSASALIRVGGSLPRLSFPQVSAPGSVAWNQGTTASVIFVPHAGECAACTSYAGLLASAAEGLREWGTRALVLVAPGTAVAAPGCLVLADQAGSGRAQLGLGQDQAAVVQADRWGAVYQVEAIGVTPADHGVFPVRQELISLAQFIDIQCPECGVPSREWMGANPFPLG